MTCCTVNITPFLQQLTTTVNYTGVKPTVTVAYLQADGTFLFAGVFTQINYIGSSVVVDHGGMATGYVKLIQ